MNSERLRNVIGVAILCLAIAASFWRVISRNLQAVTSDQIELRVVPITSCRPYANVTFAKMLRSLTQKLVRDQSPNRTMSIPELDRLILAGTFSYSKTPECIRSLELMSELAPIFIPGFLQFEHEDAIATYRQKTAL